MKKTHFEQVPVALAKQVAAREAFSSRRQSVSCVICGSPVALERCKIDEGGNAVHERCYVAKLAAKPTPDLLITEGRTAPPSTPSARIR